LLKRRSHIATRFAQQQDGTATVEGVLWLPLFIMFFCLAVDVSLVFFGQNQMHHVVQDANRAMSVGRLKTEAEVEDYIRTKLAALSEDIEVETVEVEPGRVQSTVRIQASDLMATRFTTPLIGAKVSARSSHLIEY